MIPVPVISGRGIDIPLHAARLAFRLMGGAGGAGGALVGSGGAS